MVLSLYNIRVCVIFIFILFNLIFFIQYNLSFILSKQSFLLQSLFYAVVFCFYPMGFFKLNPIAFNLFKVRRESLTI